MGITSKTGLLPTKKKVTIAHERKPEIQLKAVAIPAPYTLKPFAGLYNPYSHGCSLLCNHPADNETRDLVKKAKDAWAIEGKPLLLAEEVAAIRATLEQIQKFSENSNIFENVDNNLESVPEELFRRYTETDSRPLTPAPTVVSNYTRTSAATRRCVTPDPTLTLEVKEKTQLILDLRRSHSQETLSWFGGIGSNLSEPPLMRIQRAPSITLQEAPSMTSRSPRQHHSQEIPKCRKTKEKPQENANRSLKTEITHHRPKSSSLIKQEIKKDILPPKIVLTDGEKMDEEEEEEVMRRRGKKRHKKGRGSSGGPLPVQTSIDPETQIATIGINSHNPSARPSIASNVEVEDTLAPKITETRKTSLDIDSYLDKDILKQLRRELNEEMIDNEFNIKRRKALEEAMKTLRKNKPECEELKSLQKGLKIPTIDIDFCLTLPRTFSRSSARFELPVDSRSFSTMTPIEYLKDHVVLTSPRKLLYNYVFNRNKIEQEFDQNKREISGANMRKAFKEMMGKELTGKQFDYVRDLIGWNEEDVFDFKTFCGICALCERLLAPEFYPLTKEEDPRQEIEAVDFESLERRLSNQKTDPRLLRIMFGIRDS